MDFIKRIIAWFKRQNKSIVTEYAQSIIIIVLIAFIIRTFGFGLYQVPTCSMETTMLAGERFFANKFTVLFKKPQHGEIITFNAPNYAYSNNSLINLFQRYVYGPDNWTKRVIGVPGDHVKGVIEDGKPLVYLNGNKLDEPYLNKYPILYVYTDNQKDPLIRRSYDPKQQFDQQLFYRLLPEKVRIGAFYAQQLGRPDVLYPGSLCRDYKGFQDGLADVFDVHLKENQYWMMGDNRLGSYDSRGWGPLDAKLIHGKVKFRIWSLDTSYSWPIFDLLRHPIDFWKRVRWSRCLELVK